MKLVPGDRPAKRVRPGRWDRREKPALPERLVHRVFKVWLGQWDRREKPALPERLVHKVFKVFRD